MLSVRVVFVGHTHPNIPHPNPTAWDIHRATPISVQDCSRLLKFIFLRNYYLCTAQISKFPWTLLWTIMLTCGLQGAEKVKISFTCTFIVSVNESQMKPYLRLLGPSIIRLQNHFASRTVAPILKTSRKYDRPILNSNPNHKKCHINLNYIFKTHFKNVPASETNGWLWLWGPPQKCYYNGIILYCNFTMTWTTFNKIRTNAKY